LKKTQQRQAKRKGEEEKRAFRAVHPAAPDEPSSISVGEAAGILTQHACEDLLRIRAFGVRDAEDAFHDAALSVLSRKPIRTDDLTWWSNRLRSRTAEAYRKQARWDSQRACGVSDVADVLPGEADPVGDFMRHEELQLLWKVLNPFQQWLVEEFHLAGRTLKDLAADPGGRGVSAAAMAVQLLRARRSMKKQAIRLFGSHEEACKALGLSAGSSGESTDPKQP
jgi:hypothetical protein